MPYEPPFTSSDTINSLIMEIAELVGKLDASEALYKSPVLHRDLRIKTIYSSLVIEGNALNEKAVTAIFNGKRVLGKEEDIIAVKNAKRAYECIGTLNPYSLDDLLHAHGLMMAEILEDAGRFRRGNVAVYEDNKIIHMATPATYVPGIMKDVFTWLRNTKLHPLIASCVFHYEFEFCHPFTDGNGRTGRLWHTMLLTHWRSVFQWLPVESMICQRQSEYYKAFITSETTGTSTPFVEFMLETIRDTMLPYIKRTDENDQLKQSILEYFKKNPKASVNELSTYLSRPKRSIERMINNLKEEGLLVRKGGARGGSWYVGE